MKYPEIPQSTYHEIIGNIIVREQRVKKINYELSLVNKAMIVVVGADDDDFTLGSLPEIYSIIRNYRFNLCQEIKYLESLLESD